MKFKQTLILLLFTLFLIAIGSTPVLADTVSDNYNNYTYPLSTYKKPVIQPFSMSTSGQTENISPATGGLEISQTDLSLKGKNGLDFNLTRIYRSSDALLYEPACSYNPNFIEPYVQGYYVTGTQTTETYTNGTLTGTTYKTVSFCAGPSSYWSTSQQAQIQADLFNGGEYNSSTVSGNICTVIKYNDKQDFNVQLQVFFTSSGGIILMNRYYQDCTNSLTANDKFYNLGTGWSFDLPYIEQRGNAGGQINGNVDFYLNMGSQGVTHFTWQINYYDLYANWLDPSYSIPLETNGFGDLQLYYLVNKSTPIYSNSEGSASFKLIEKDGKTLYFGHNGTLMAIVDRFGNQIQFLHYNGLISQVIDSVGRKINITYQDSKVTVGVDDETNPSNNRLIYYNKTINPTNSSKYLLTSVTDAENRVTQYTYDQKNGNFSFWKKDPFNSSSSPDGIDFYECLNSITYPSGGKTVYTYNDGKYSYQNLGVAGFLHFYKVINRSDYATDGTRYNCKSYDYCNDFNGGGDGNLEYDGYPNYSVDCVPGGYKVKTNVYDAADNTETYTYNYFKALHNDLLCTDIVYSGDRYRETINTYDSTSRLLTQCINRTYSWTSGAYIDKIENYDYDNLKNVLDYWDPQANGDTNNTEHKTTYTYGANNLLTSKTYKRDANNTIKEQNTLSNDGKTVTTAQVYENNVLQKQTGYIYDSYGNVTEQRDYLSNWTDFISTHYDYTDNDSSRNGKFNGLYLTRKWVDGVKDPDGNSVVAKSPNSAGTVDETSKYDWFGNVVQKQDGQGNLASTTYDKLGRVTAEVNPDSTSKTYSYTTNTTENSVLATDERGMQIKSIFDQFGNLTYKIDMTSGQNLSHYTYDSLFRLQSEDNNNTSQSGRTITYQYTSDGRKKQNLTTGKDGKRLNEEDFTYDDANSNGTYNKTTKTVAGDASSPSITTVTYANKLGQVERQGKVDNGTELLDTYQYDYLGNKTQEKSARAYAEGWSQGYTAKNDYNYAGKPIKTYNVNGDYTTTQYDALGRKTIVTDILGNKSTTPYSTTYTYDNLGRVIEEDTPFQNTNGTLFTTVKKHYYDRNGNITLEKVSSNKPGQVATYDQTGYEYNSRNMLTKAITYNSGSPVNYTQYYYDAAGNKVRMYTGLSQPLQINGLDNVTPGTDTVYSVTKYDYNRFNKLQAITDPVGKQELSINDLNGNLVQQTDRNGSTITMTYDGVGRLLTKNVANIANPKLNASSTYTYSSTGNRTAMSGGGASATYTYDDLGRLIKETDGNAIEKDYTYDTANNRLSFIIKQNGQVKTNTSYDYDNLNRQWHVYENNSTTPTTTYSYDANGNRATQVNINGDTVTYQYNLANKLTQLANNKGSTELSQYTYAYYLNGNQANKTDSTGKTNDYVYDGLGRLGTETETVSGNATVTAYTYDDANNRATMTVTGTAPYAVTYVYDSNNRLNTETKVTGVVTQKTTYGYDDNGNQISSSTETIQPAVAGQQEGFGASVSGQSADSSKATINQYDGFNQLIGTTVGDKTVTYTYDGDGLRGSKTVNGATTDHVWDGDQIALETDGFGNVTNKYLRGINLIAADEGLAARKYFNYNGHGDVTGLTDTSGNLTKSYDYDAFGNEKNIDPNDANVFRYSGEYYDKETGTIYLRARNYNPVDGRFTSEDSVWGKNINLLKGYYDWLELYYSDNKKTLEKLKEEEKRYNVNDPLSLNLYTYCGNNPVLYVDPSGRDAIIITDTHAVQGFGHTSIIIQDKNENWYYFYWSNDKAILQQVDDPNVLKDIQSFNKWVRENTNYDGNYDESIYVKGDFDKSYNEAYTAVKKYEPGTFTLDNYNLIFNNCSQMSYKLLDYGTLDNGLSFSSVVRDNITVPYAQYNYASGVLGNNSFTN